MSLNLLPDALLAESPLTDLPPAGLPFIDSPFANSPAPTPLRVGLVGFGCVGQGFYDLVQQLPAAGVRVARIAVKTHGKARPLPAERFEFDPDALLDDPTLDVLVELIDDPAEALRLVSAALRRGRRVVSANKALLAEHLPALLRLEAAHGGTLLYEAAVAGSIPVLRTLDAHFGHEPLRAVRGIINGSSNYVLTQMGRRGSTYATALAEAQALGFAETDPALDMAAFDPRAKAVLLAAHAFGLLVPPAAVLNLGIEHIAPADLAFAAAHHATIKVVADLQQQPDGRVSLLVAPRLVLAGSPLATVEDEFNGLEVTAAFGGLQFWQGRGAGGHPTGSAVLADVLALRRGFRYGYAKLRGPAAPAATLATNLAADFYLRATQPQNLAPALALLGLGPEAVTTAAAGPHATARLALARLHEHRDALRTLGVFTAQMGEVG